MCVAVIWLHTSPKLASFSSLIALCLLLVILPQSQAWAQIAGDSEPRKVWFVPSLMQGLYLYRDHPTRGLTSASTARLAAWIYQRWLFAASYRFSYFGASDRAEGYGASSAAWRQHDGYGTLGYAAPRFGISLHYGVLSGSLSATPDYAQTSHHVGFAARYSPFGDGLLALTASLFPDEVIYRGELGWALPLIPATSSWGLKSRSLRLRPAVAVQWSGGEWRPSGSLTVSFEHPRFAVFVGGKYGSELRPAYLPQEVVYNGPERIPLGLWAGGSLRPSARDGTTLSLNYAFDRLLRDVTDISTLMTSTLATQAHYLTFAIARPF
jgi:hypothetical protein